MEEQDSAPRETLQAVVRQEALTCVSEETDPEGNERCNSTYLQGQRAASWGFCNIDDSREKKLDAVNLITESLENFQGYVGAD